MKKIFTLIAATMMAVAVSAQSWQVINSVKGGAIAEGTVLADDDYVTATSANQNGTPGQILDEAGDPKTVTFGSYTFGYYVNVRVTDAPSASNPTGTAHSADDGTQNIAIVVKAKQNADVTFYFRRGSSKSFDCYNQTSGESVSGIESVEEEDGDNLYIASKFQLVGGNTYTFWAKGGTIQMYGFDTAKGTYVAPTASYYANGTAAKVDGYSTITYADGSKLVLIGNSGKDFGPGSNVSVNGKTYKGTKVSNGAQNKFVCPEGKKAYAVTFYSVVNKDAATDRACYWKEVNGTEYTEADAKIMESYKDANNPDVNTYALGGVSEFTFTNTGEQNYFVLEVSYDPSGVAGVVEATETSNAVVKAVKNGQVVIVKNGAEYTVSGAQIK
mgnify:FL=1